MKEYYCLLSFLFICFSSFTQVTILCPEIITEIKINDPNNIPTVSENGDGTITLIHSESYITDIFANYVIYDFYQYSPNSNPTGELFKYYSIVFQSKDLINDLKQNIPSEIFSSYSAYESTALNTDLINFLDNKKFVLKKYCEESDSNSCVNENVSLDYELKVQFNYDSTNDLLLLESIGLTPCGNSFSIAFKGGITNNMLQLWQYTPGTTVLIDYSNPHCPINIEDVLFNTIDISCLNYGIGDINAIINTEDNILVLNRQTGVFGVTNIVFEEDVLSINENIFENIKIYQTKNNPYLQISTSNNNQLYVEIFSTSGQLVLEKTPFSENKILINQLSNNLCFVKVYNSQNQFKVFKFLKR